MNKKILLIIIVHLAITIPLAVILNVWYDESWSLRTSEGDLFSTIKHSYENEYQPPVYFVLLNLWRKIDSSYYFARFLSIIFSVGSLLVSYFVLKKHLKVEKPEFSTFLLSINPFLIYLALEIRLYSMTVFFSGMLIYLMYEIYFCGNKSAKNRIIFILIAVLSLHTQYYMCFLLIAIGFNVLIFKGRDNFKLYLIDMVIPMISTILIITNLFIVSSTLKISQEFAEINFIGLFEYFRKRLLLYSIPLPTFNLSRNKQWAVLIFLIMLFLLFLKGEKKKLLKIFLFKKNSTLLIVIILLISYITILIITSRRIAEPRHTAALFLPLFFLINSFIFLIKDKRVLIFWFILFFSAYSAGLFNRFNSLSKEGDFIRLSRYLEDKDEGRGIIFVPYDIFAMPLKVHYDGESKIISLYKLLNEKKDKELLQQIKTSDKFWYYLPYPDPGREDLSRQINITSRFILNNFSISDTVFFNRMHLWTLNPKKDK